MTNLIPDLSACFGQKFSWTRSLLLNSRVTLVGNAGGWTFNLRYPFTGGIDGGMLQYSSVSSFLATLASYNVRYRHILWLIRLKRDMRR